MSCPLWKVKHGASSCCIAALAAWRNEQWLKEQVFWLTHLRGYGLTAERERMFKASKGPFKECVTCPEMVIVPHIAQLQIAGCRFRNLDSCVSMMQSARIGCATMSPRTRWTPRLLRPPPSSRIYSKSYTNRVRRKARERWLKMQRPSSPGEAPVGPSSRGSPVIPPASGRARVIGRRCLPNGSLMAKSKQWSGWPSRRPSRAIWSPCDYASIAFCHRVGIAPCISQSPR